jgi:hypothetical protein
VNGSGHDKRSHQERMAGALWHRGGKS